MNFIRRKLGKAIWKSGKVFYSSPHSLFTARWILMGYNPGGAPSSKAGCRINDNLQDWSGIETSENHYWSQSWNPVRDDYNRLQRQVHVLFSKLATQPAEVFASNLSFLRSRTASMLKQDVTEKEVSLEIWRTFFACCPSRYITCIGRQTAHEFLEQIEAEIIHENLIQTSHPRASAILATVQMQGIEYRIAGLPHLSRFSVAGDPKLIRAIKHHFQMVR